MSHHPSDQHHVKVLRRQVAGEYEAARDRIRAEARRLADVHRELHHAINHLEWQGHAADRFTAEVRRRLDELSHRELLLTALAGLLDEAASAKPRVVPVVAR